MKTRKELLEEASLESSVYFMAYTRLRSKAIDHIFVLEGKDDPKFYTPHISSSIKSKYEIISVNGKTNVLTLREEIRNHPEYRSDSTAFFIDSDFDKIPSKKDLYVTPTYSIENFYTKSSVFRSIITGECRLSEIKIDPENKIKDSLTEKYEKMQESFHKNKRVIFANAVFMYTRLILKDKNTPLDDILKLDIKITNGRLSVKINKKEKYNIKRSNRKNFIDFLNTSNDFISMTKSPSDRFRGKQEIMFMREFIAGISRSSGYLSRYATEMHASSLTRKPKQELIIKLDRASFGEQIISDASAYVKKPACLSLFLETFESL